VSVNPHYDAVLTDLQQMKEDAEDGIRAIKRLMSRAAGAGISPTQPPPGTSVANQIVAFLEAQNGRSLRIEEIAKALLPANIKTVRGALARLAKQQKIGKHGRGKYRAARRGREEPTPS
jgi:hypothetical protein